MKASVQYNDFIGTAAADRSDSGWIDRILKERGVDIERFEAIGVSFYSGYSQFFSASIICLDKEKSTEKKDYIVSIGFENEFTREQFFNLFKRFKVIITNKYQGFENHEIDEEITFDDRKKNSNN